MGAAHPNADGVVALLVDREQPTDLFGNIVEPLVVGHVHWSMVPRTVPDPFRAIELLDQNELLLAIRGPSRRVAELREEGWSIRRALRGQQGTLKHQTIPARVDSPKDPYRSHSSPNPLLKAAADLASYNYSPKKALKKSPVKKRLGELARIQKRLGELACIQKRLGD